MICSGQKSKLVATLHRSPEVLRFHQRRREEKGFGILPGVEMVALQLGAWIAALAGCQPRINEARGFRRHEAAEDIAEGRVVDGCAENDLASGGVHARMLVKEAIEVV